MRSDPPFLGRGWAFPPSFSAGGAEVEMVSGVEDVHQSLRILLGTTPGERVMQEDFGCDLASLVFEELDYGLVSRIARLVEGAIAAHEPRVDVDRVDASRSPTEPACLMVKIQYTIRGVNSRYNMVFPFYLTEATLPGM